MTFIPTPSSVPILGLDPGLRYTGWGVIEAFAHRVRFVAAGVIAPPQERSLAERLAYVHVKLEEIVVQFKPKISAIEKVFVNKNPATTLLLGMARGVVMVVPAECGVPVMEYGANVVKKRLTNAGHASKEQVAGALKLFLPNVPENLPNDASDALAVAMCHAYTMR